MNKIELQKAKALVGQAKFYEPQIQSISSSMNIYMAKRYLQKLKHEFTYLNGRYDKLIKIAKA